MDYSSSIVLTEFGLIYTDRSARTVKISSCILSLLSPVLRTMMCGSFRERIRKEIMLQDVEAEQLLKLLRLACGQDGPVVKDAHELLGLGELADRLQMEAVRIEVEDELSKILRVENCLEIIQRSEGSGLVRLQKECYKMLWDEFEMLARKEGFLNLSEETIGNLLDHDDLGLVCEQDVFEALVKWMRNNNVGVRDEGLLRKIRYGVISEEYLTGLMSWGLLPGHEMLKELVREALAKKESRMDVGKWDGVERLCTKWKVPRMKARVIGADVLKYPEYIAVDGQGRIVVSDSQLHEIIVFNRDGTVARRIGSQGAAAGEFDKPTGVAVDRQGHIIVADYGNDRIQVLSLDGTVARCFGSRGGEVDLDRPYGVAIDREGHIVVSDSGNHRIQVFDADGCLLRRFGSRGAAIGQLRRPSGVAVDGAGRIVVADHDNHRVQVFNSDGSVALCFGSEGNDPGQLRGPQGVAVDSAGRYVVAEWGNDRVQVFNSDGSVARVIGSPGGGVGQLWRPCGVVADGADRILVAEGSGPWSSCNNHRVQLL